MHHNENLKQQSNQAALWERIGYLKNSNLSITQKARRLQKNTMSKELEN